jgi:hypothetical protein
MTLTMARVEEFYESPHANIKGRYFTWEQFIDAYSDEKGTLTYFSEWEGFNVPAEYLCRFRNMFLDLSAREAWLLSVVDGADYVIATDAESDPSTLPHELAHARYRLDNAYRKSVQQIIKPMPKDLSLRFQRDLLAAGYPDDVDIMLDEIHAYLKTSTEDELLEAFLNVAAPERAPYEAALRQL